LRIAVVLSADNFMVFDFKRRLKYCIISVCFTPLIKILKSYRLYKGAVEIRN